MATISLAKKSIVGDNICQGDVYKDVRYNYINSDTDDEVEIVELIFPLAIIVSQACDVLSMGEMILHKGGKATKFMPSILLCPIYNAEKAKNLNHISEAMDKLSIRKEDLPTEKLFNSKEMEISLKDWHYRFHSLSFRLLEAGTLLKQFLGILEVAIGEAQHTLHVVDVLVGIGHIVRSCRNNILLQRRFFLLVRNAWNSCADANAHTCYKSS